jgi:hypothetical protein
MSLMTIQYTYLPRKLIKFTLDREEAVYDGLIMKACPVNDFFHRERLVEGYAEVLDLGGHDHALGVVRHVPQVPGRDRVLRWAVGADLYGEEVIRLVLALELSGELCLRDSLPLSLWLKLVETLHFCLKTKFNYKKAKILGKLFKKHASLGERSFPRFKSC